VLHVCRPPQLENSNRVSFLVSPVVTISGLLITGKSGLVSDNDIGGIRRIDRGGYFYGDSFF